MSMSAEHDDRLDEVLQQVVSQLRRPVRLDPSVDRGALERIRAESALRVTPRRGPRWGVWLAGAALAAGILLAVMLPGRPRPGGQPVRTTALEQAEGPTDARPVRLRLAAPASSRVAVVGDFNNWDPAATPLRRAGGGTWIVELRLKPGRYHYTFLIDGRRWARDPSEPPAIESDFGAPVSVLTVS